MVKGKYLLRMVTVGAHKSEPSLKNAPKLALLPTLWQLFAPATLVIIFIPAGNV
jgi:hypothetical protein